MKLKYYLRGLGIGIIVTTIILMVSFSQRDNSISDEEVIARAEVLGMVMPEDETQETSGSTELSGDVGQEGAEPQDTDAVSEGEDVLADSASESGDASSDNGSESGDASSDNGSAENVTDDEVGAGDEAQTDVYRLTIRQGDVCRTVCEDLAENGVIEDAEALRTYLFEIGYASSMSTGQYDIPYGLTIEEVAQILQAGPVEE